MKVNEQNKVRGVTVAWTHILDKKKLSADSDDQWKWWQNSIKQRLKIHLLNKVYCFRFLSFLFSPTHVKITQSKRNCLQINGNCYITILTNTWFHVDYIWLKVSDVWFTSVVKLNYIFRKPIFRKIKFFRKVP